jgi:hypothetical protein
VYVLLAACMTEAAMFPLSDEMFGDIIGGGTEGTPAITRFSLGDSIGGGAGPPM